MEIRIIYCKSQLSRPHHRTTSIPGLAVGRVRKDWEIDSLRNDSKNCWRVPWQIEPEALQKTGLLFCDGIAGLFRSTLVVDGAASVEEFRLYSYDT